MYRAQYKKYVSDSDSESATDSSESDSASDSDSNMSVEGFQGADFSALANGLLQPAQGLDASDNIVEGRGFPIVNEQIASFEDVTITPEESGVKLETATQSVTSIILIDSTNRDRVAYPQPTNLTLRLPRTYKNVTGFQIVQMKLLSAFYYFNAAKFNIDISILELGRTDESFTGQTVDTIVKSIIRQGTYDINSLLTEIMVELNVTPIFYDFINGFNDFAKKFVVTGDFGLNFNFPGDTYYDSLLQQFIPNPTSELIISKYFVNRFANLSTYTTDQVKIAYFYPVLKEILLDENYSGPPVNLTLVTSAGDLLPGETPYSRVVYTFQGLNDTVVLELISNNIPILTTYRLNHTFRYALINKYNVIYEPQSNQIIFQAPTLNTSLVNLITYKQAQFFAEQLSYYGLTLEQFNNLAAQNAILLAIINDMVTYYQQYLATIFGIPFNTFSINYLLNNTLTLPIRDGYEAIGVNSNYSPNLNATENPISNDILQEFRKNAPQYWNRIQDLSGSSVAHMNPVLPGESGAGAINYYTWNTIMDAQDTLHPIVSNNVLDPANPNTTTIGNLYVNRQTQYADVIVPLEAAEYTVFRFKSPVRQTLRVETLPRPTKYRYPAYNAITYDISHQTLFDNSYCYVDVSANANMGVLGINIAPIPGFSTRPSVNGFGANYSTSIGYWATSTTTISVLEPRAFHTFYTPLPPTFSSIEAAAYKYPLRLTVAHSNPAETFTTPLQIFLYQDRGAFMADISDNRNEKAIHYISTTSSFTDVSSTSMEFIAYANKQYYLITRSQPVSFGTETFRIVPSFPSSTNFLSLTSTLTGFDPLADPAQNFNNFNYAQVGDPAFIRLPIASTLYSPPLIDSAFSTLTFSTVLMGYDSAGVSTDLTNYIGFLSNVTGANSFPTSQIRIDPTNGFLAQAKSPYNSSLDTYFNSNSPNTLLYPNGAGVYAPSTIANRQVSIVHWYGNTFLPPTNNQILYDPKSIAYQTIPPFTNNYPVQNPIGGYTYYTTLDVSGSTYLNTPNLVDMGDGVIGIAFLPGQGLWDIDKFMFKSIFTSSDPAVDPNLGIAHIGIYSAVTASNSVVQNYALSNAVAVLSFASSITYNSSNQNFGFDKAGGTYYEFNRDSNYIVGSNSYLYGYSQSAREYIFDLNTYYIAVPFDSAGRIQYYYGLVGSPVPYPYYSQVSTCGAVPSPEGPLSPPTGYEFVLPSGTITGASTIFGPPTGGNVYQSQYEQSMPIGTNLLLYANPYPINTVTTPFRAWSPFNAVPTDVVTDCSGFVLTVDNVFRIFSYQSGTSNTSFEPAYEMTLDEIFPTNSNIDYLGVAANESNFAFFGLSNASPSPYLYIRTFDPKEGSLQTVHSEVSPQGFQSSVQLFKATYNNFGGYVMSCKSYDAGTNTTGIVVVSKGVQTDSNVTRLYRQTPDATINNYLIGQSPKEQYGRFWVFPNRNNGINDFIYVNPNASNLSPPVGNYTAEYGGVYGTVTPFSLSNTGPYISPIVTRDVARDRIHFLKTAAPTSFFEAPIITGQSTPTIVTSVYTFPSTPTSLYAGANGGAWALIGDTLYGNRKDNVDGPKAAIQGWQIFYPVHRIVFHQISKNFTVLYDLSGLQYPEYPHTALAVYDSSGNFTADTSGKWGLESSSNFNTADFTFSGYYFNAYTFGAPLQDNRASDDFYYLSVRNYSPTEKSQVTLRLSAPNKYTYGYVTPVDISGEISTAKYVVSTMDTNYTYYWDTNYINSLLTFDSNFIIDSNGKTFGGGVIAGFPGSNISSVTGFGDFYGRIQAVFSTYSTQVLLTSTINAATNSNVEAFIRTDLQYIIPAAALNRQRFTDPLRYSILWKSSLLPQVANAEDQWGLGWNLGFAKEDTPYETVHRGASFFKIIDDFINLQMNPEYDMNRMDTTNKEKLSETQDSTGETKAFHGKLLLAPFGNYAQTMISNPIAFLNPLGGLDRLTFTWTDATGTVIDNNDCEWNAVVQISESLDVTTFPKLPLINPAP